MDHWIRGRTSLEIGESQRLSGKTVEVYRAPTEAKTRVRSLPVLVLAAQTLAATERM